MSDVFNELYNEIVPDGAAGNQAYEGLFYRNRLGKWRRMTQAEGHEKALNPETEEKNLIAMKNKTTIVRSFTEQFSKSFLITKGEENYEFFNEFAERKYTGKNAQVPIMWVDFKKNESAGNGKQKYKAKVYTCTVTVTTANFTDGTLSVDFNQAGEEAFGVSEFDGTDYTFSSVTVGKIVTSLTDAELSGGAILGIGNERWVSIDIGPMGAPENFEVSVDHPEFCKAEIRRSSVVLTGVATGTAEITISAGSVTKTFEVLVS
jgi:hypothetical protein